MSMIDPSVDSLLEKTDKNRYILALGLIEEAKHLKNRKPLVKVTAQEKPIVIAARELFLGKIEIVVPAVKA
ncbi:MAG: DNA-directed RNA polymerase subunit omega [Firmicutes bacterium]|nr:DNA-directed RNA polymerase subunit omega [Bacillota bacterium]